MAPNGVNVVGYLDAPLGIGQVARNVSAALADAGVAVAEITVASDVGLGEGGGAPPATAYPVSIVCINPDGLPGAEAQLGRAFFADRHTIGYWWWELSTFPPGWERAFDLVDEVWTGSRFVADAIAPAAPVPVLRMPVPVAAPERRSEPAELPEGFKFLTVYDYRSVTARKNPLGAIEAFRRAFDGAGDAALVLKSIGADERPDEHAAVVAAAEEAGNVAVIDGVMAPEEVDSLVAACDAYVSLHRAEGLGLPLAAALHAGKPVVATAYGGPTDFLTAENSYPVGFRLTSVGAGHAPYPADAQWADPDLDAAADAMRRVVGDRDDAAARAAAGRRDAARLFSFEAAGAKMAERLSRVTVGGGSAETESAIAELVRVLDSEPQPPPGRRGEAVRARLRRALYRVLRPYATHRREVDAEVVRALRAMEQRIAGLERSLEVLKVWQAERDDERGERRRPS